MIEPATQEIRMLRIRSSSAVAEDDLVAIEEPLEIRIGYSEAGKRVSRSISITMRTPGSDSELAVGFLFTEGLIQSKDQILAIAPTGRPIGQGGGRNTIRVDLHPNVVIPSLALERNFYTTSSCGVCGKASIEAISELCGVELPSTGPTVGTDLLHTLPDAARRVQHTFEDTGGLHGAVLFGLNGERRYAFEDVGRHNALDKLIGAALLEDSLPLKDDVLFISSRTSFEIVQKTLRAGIPILAAAGAPSSLAISLAREHGLTLIGFLRDQRFNIYSGEWRVRT